MKKLILLFVLFSCSDRDYVQLEPGQQGTVTNTATDIVTDRSGRQYPFLDPNVISYCGPGWGRKFCLFLENYDGVVWEYPESSEFASITFSNFPINENFISFVNLDTISPYGQSWKLGETTYDNKKWNIKIKKDEDDVLWISYDYYGSGEEIESSTIYKCEVIDGLLNFSSNQGQTFIFHPS